MPGTYLSKFAGIRTKSAGIRVNLRQCVPGLFTLWYADPGAHAKVGVITRSHQTTTLSTHFTHTYKGIDDVDRAAWLKDWKTMPDLEAQAPGDLARRTLGRLNSEHTRLQPCP